MQKNFDNIHTNSRRLLLDPEPHEEEVTKELFAQESAPIKNTPLSTAAGRPKQLPP